MSAPVPQTVGTRGGSDIVVAPSAKPLPARSARTLGTLVWQAGAAFLVLVCVPDRLTWADAAATLSPQEQHGKQRYESICIYCHGPGVWGTNRLARRLDKEHAQLSARTDLTAAGIRAVVRNGLGSMPPLRRTEISDSDLEAIAAYLTRKERP